MNELIKELIGKKCKVLTVDNAYIGQITALEDGWVSIEAHPPISKKDTKSIINTKFIISIEIL